MVVAGRDRARRPLVWLIAVQPALRTLRETPAELDRLDSQLQQMQLAALESETLRGASPVPADAGRRGAARRDRAPRRQGQARDPGRPRDAHASPACPSRPCAPGSARRAARRARGRSRRSCSRARQRLQRLDLARAGGRVMIRRKRNRQLWAPTVASTGWSESTLAEQAWVEARGAGGPLGDRRRDRRRRSSAWSLFAPAAWLAQRGRLVDRRPPRPRRRARHGLVGQRRRRARRRRRTAATPARCPAGSSGRCRRAATAPSSRRARTAA